jgi:hypothetical protein
MPTIVIVLMFLVAFLLAVLAMILMPILGVSCAVWNKSQVFGSDYAAGMQCSNLKTNPEIRDSHRHFKYD